MGQRKRRKNAITHAEQQNGVQPRPSVGLDPEDDGREGYLLVLPEDVDPETHDDDGCDVYPSCACLDCLEDEQADGGDDDGKPGDEVVDGTADQRGGAHAEHAYQTEEANHKARDRVE